MTDAPNATIATFGYPGTLIAELDRWVVLLRPRQITLGSLVLACKEEATAFGQISPKAVAELGQATAGLEAMLRSAFAYDKINYLMLMMVDPHVHFHVVPRYAAPRGFDGRDFADAFWPKPPDVTQALPLEPAAFQRLGEHLRAAWPAA